MKIGSELRWMEARRVEYGQLLMDFDGFWKKRKQGKTGGDCKTFPEGIFSDEEAGFVGGHTPQSYHSPAFPYNGLLMGI